jgi:hypothetical protein
MAKRTLVLASLVLALGVAAVSGAYAAGMTTPVGNFTPIGQVLPDHHRLHPRQGRQVYL